MSETLADFLLARIAEDEAEALAAVGRGIQWRYLANEVGAHDAAAGLHVLRWNPGRTLEECEAKRRIVHRGDPGSLRALAAVHAGHPDYREEWKA